MEKKITIILVAILIIGVGVWIFYSSGKDGEMKLSAEQEVLRQQKVAAELGRLFKVEINTNIKERLQGYDDVTKDEVPIYEDGIKELLKVAPIMQFLYQKQIGIVPEDFVHAVTEDDKELIRLYAHPWCMADRSELANALSTVPKRTSGIIAEGVACNNVKGSPFEAVIIDNKAQKIIPYAKMWENELKGAFADLQKASEIFAKIPREEKLSMYLKNLAEAFKSEDAYPFSISDRTWIDFTNSDSILFVRIGPDEVGGDGVGDDCEAKARYHFNLGFRNNKVSKLVSSLENSGTRFEKQFDNLISDPVNYKATDINVEMPLFIDVVLQNGDDIGSANGTNVGQTLPNWCGSDGKAECARATMIYVNKSVNAYKKEMMQKYIMPLLSENLRTKYAEEAGIDSVVYHEIFHSVGPRDKKLKPDSKMTYGEGLVTKDGDSWKGPMEELKAQTGALWMTCEFYKDAKDAYERGTLDKEKFQREQDKFEAHIVYDVMWAIRMILRASVVNGYFDSKSPYSKLAAVQIGFLTEKGALIYDKEKGEWNIDFQKMPNAVESLMQKLGTLYSKSDPQAVKKFFQYYISGDGSKYLHINRIIEIAKNMPSAIFEYEIN